MSSAISQRLRLWVVTECYPRPGALFHCPFIHRQMIGVRHAGWDVDVLVPNGWYPPIAWRLASPWRRARAAQIPSGWALDGIRVRNVAFQNRVPSRLSRPMAVDIRIANALESFVAGNRLQQSKHELMLCEFALPFGPSVRHACARLGLPYVVHLRGDDVWIWPHQSPTKLDQFRVTLRDAAVVLAVSQSILAEARRLSDLELPRAAIIPNGVDTELFQPPTAEQRASLRREFAIDGKTAILAVAAPLARKGWRELFSALASLDRTDLIVLAATVGEADMDLESECASIAPAVRLRVWHGLTAIELSRLHKGADLFCLASHGEGMSNALLEAMASGLPCVATHVGGHAEALTSGVEGQLVAPRDPRALAGALRSLLDDPALRARMGAAGRRRAVAIGTSTQAGGRMAALFERLLTGDLPARLPDVNPYAA